MTDGLRKGNAAMLDVCRILSGWHDPKTNFEKTSGYDLPFRIRTTDRQPIEGHWQGKGDILHRPDVKFPFSVEVKKREGWTLEGAWSEKWPVWAWWDQCCRQAAASTPTLEPILFFSRNRQPWFVLLPERTAQCLSLRSVNGPVLRVQRPGKREPLSLATHPDVVLTRIAALA